MNIQQIAGPLPVNGHRVTMETSDPLHYDNNGSAARPADDVTGSFYDALMSAVGNVNNLQVDSENLVKKMIYAPESVDIHTVMIAQQKAEISLSLAKTVRDEAIKAYRELTNLR